MTITAEKVEKKKVEKVETKEEISTKPTEVITEVHHDPIRAKWKEESRLVKGIFRCHEPRGGTVTFSFKKYKWDPVKHYTLTDGEEHEIPLAVARHLNQHCSYEKHSHVLDKNGNPSVDTNKKVSRMNFESLEFSL